MKIGEIVSDTTALTPFGAETALSFKPFVDHLRELASQGGGRSEFYHYAVSKFEDSSALEPVRDFDVLSRWSDLLNLIHVVVTPMLYKEENHFWALSTPNPGQVFFGTDIFYEFFDSQTQSFDLDNVYRKQQISLTYKLLLERFYKIPLRIENKILYTDNSFGTTRYFTIDTDTSFLAILPLNPLPALTEEEIEAYLLTDDVKLIEQLLPLSLFKFEGFTIISISNVTAQQATVNIEEMLASHGQQNFEYRKIFQSLKSLAGEASLEFGLLPLLKVNDKAVYLYEGCSQSMIMHSAHKSGVEEETLNVLLNKYREDPKPFVFSKTTDTSDQHPFSAILRKAGMPSYALVPLYHRKQLTGVLEFYSHNADAIHPEHFSNIQPALSMLGELLYYNIDDFNLRIESIIKDQFTPIKSSVQWKFNEAAWKYLKGSKGSGLPIAPSVAFESVFPLYGAVDVRNSTVERNAAVHADIEYLLILLKSLLSSFKEIIPHVSLASIENHWNSWMPAIDSFSCSNDEAGLNRFLAVNVEPFLKEISQTNPATTEHIQKYFEEVSVSEGSAHKNRREFEASLQLINHTVSSHLDAAQKDLQESYPHYFEKFRTDGVEYDIYIGQSIRPEMAFEDFHLRTARIWQLRSMAEIARLGEKLLNGLPRKLKTTQLIFVHSNPIDISFRTDERHFDVEGAYSIRYEVIKKRIDKVQILGTKERLTQPDTIAIVYSLQSEADEYLEYIQQLQQADMLETAIEFLELERLQGVDGLKALRVRVKNLQPAAPIDRVNDFKTELYLSS
ncbi:MAG TPA: hypothetical protein VF602_00700 [Pedobacter sp.]|jgi:hypothetical protein